MPVNTQVETRPLKAGNNQTNMNGLGKLPPQEIETEKAVLAAILIEKDAIISVLDKIKASDFYKTEHENIFQASMDLFNQNKAIDLLTVINKLKANGKLEESGGAGYITELTTYANSSAHIEHHALIVKEASMKRSIIRIASEALKNAYVNSDVFELLDQISSSLIDINSSFDQSKTKAVREYIPEVVSEIKHAADVKDHITGIPTSISLVNQFTGGWQDTNLIIVAARPSMGKTDLAINLSMDAAKAGKKVAFFSLEMSGKEITKRVVSIETEIYRSKVKTGKLSDMDWTNITKIKNEVLDNILIQDTPSLSSIQFHAIAKMLKLKFGIDMIVVDYIQLMNGTKKGNREQEISEISRTCKMVGMELKIPVIALSQLSRAVETRGGDKRPILSDLRESGAIEQDANIVIFPYRAEKYGIDSDEEGNSTENIMEWIFAKNRDGSIGSVATRYLDSIGKIYNIGEGVKEPVTTYNPDKFHSNGVNDFETKNKAPF